MKELIPRAAMSKEERKLRSRASQILSRAGLVHGSLSRRLQRCGKPGCHCTRGEKHETFVLVLRREGKTIQIPIPRWLAPAVRKWVDQEKDLQDLVRRISELQAERIQEMKKAQSKE